MPTLSPQTTSVNDGTHDIRMKDDLANSVRSSGYQEIDSVLKIVIEVWKGVRSVRPLRGS